MHIPTQILQKFVDLKCVIYIGLQTIPLPLSFNLSDINTEKKCRLSDTWSTACYSEQRKV